MDKRKKEKYMRLKGKKMRKGRDRGKRREEKWKEREGESGREGL